LLFRIFALSKGDLRATQSCLKPNDLDPGIFDIECLQGASFPERIMKGRRCDELQWARKRGCQKATALEALPQAPGFSEA
jgi:hypothetical protein